MCCAYVLQPCRTFKVGRPSIGTSVAMADVATITLDIDERIAYIAGQVGLGCNRVEVIAEQVSELLNKIR